LFYDAQKYKNLRCKCSHRIIYRGKADFNYKRVIPINNDKRQQ